MQELNVKFDPEVDGLTPKVIRGTFPAHIVGWEEGEVYNGSIPFNILYRIATDATEFIGYDFNSGEEAKGTVMVGQELKSNGVWLCPNPKSGEGWRNRGYIEFAKSVGIDFPEDEDSKINLQQIEMTDVLGLPVLVLVGQQVHKDDKEKDPADQRKYPRVFKTFLWEDGERIDPEDLFAEDDQDEEIEFPDDDTE